MLGTLGFFILASVLRISDATLKEGPTFKNFIKNAIQFNEKAIPLLQKSIFPMADVLKEANDDLKQVLEEEDLHGKFKLLRSALDKETQGLSMIGVFCEEPKADCKKARRNAAESTVVMTTAVSEICEAKRTVIDDIFTEIKSSSDSDFEFEMWTVGVEVLREIENGC